MKRKLPIGKSTVLMASALAITMLGVVAFPRGAKVVDSQVTTVILVRHGEKAIVPPENKDPDLSPAGVTRAQQLASMFGSAGVELIYVSQFKRTQQTVKPLAEKLGLQGTQVEARNTAEIVKQIKARTGGGVIFIAGHNNTVPEIIAGLGGPKLPIIPETEYDNLFILTITGDGTAKLLKLKY